jgi:hypothetical protein
MCDGLERKCHRLYDSSSQPMTSGNAVLSVRRWAAFHTYAPATFGAATLADMRCTSDSGSLVMAEGRALTDYTRCGWPSVSRLFLPADDERERRAIYLTMGCFSHVRT